MIMVSASLLWACENGVAMAAPGVQSAVMPVGKQLRLRAELLTRGSQLQLQAQRLYPLRRARPAGGAYRHVANNRLAAVDAISVAGDGILLGEGPRRFGLNWRGLQGPNLRTSQIWWTATPSSLI